MIKVHDDLVALEFLDDPRQLRLLMICKRHNQAFQQFHIGGEVLSGQDLDVFRLGLAKSLLRVDLEAPFIARLQTNCNSCPATFTQIAAVAALEGPQDSVDHMVQEFKKRRDVVVKGLNDLPGVIERIEGSGLREVVVTNTIPLNGRDQKCSKLKLLSVAPLLGEAILRIHREESVTSLFV